jgi:hypothetical protein
VFNRTYKFLNNDTTPEKDNETNSLNNFNRDNFDRNSALVNIIPTQVSRFSKLGRRNLTTGPTGPDVNIIKKKIHNNYSLEMSCITVMMRAMSKVRPVSKKKIANKPG